MKKISKLLYWVEEYVCSDFIFYFILWVEEYVRSVFIFSFILQ